ncbi:hypothetical protein [Lactococcus lactis]|uniref:hypothetical protein n=1 Tax=Lactococcus lactis TaxID=1358 RepID=UPI00315C9BB9
MQKTTKWISKKRFFVITGIIVAALTVVGGKVYMDKEAEKKEMQELALKDDKAIAQKIKDNFSGVEEITFHSTSKLPSEPGGYKSVLSVKYSWSDSLSESARSNNRSVNYESLGKAKEMNDDFLVSDIVGFVDEKSSDIYMKHFGQTETSIKVIYPNGEEEQI